MTQRSCEPSTNPTPLARQNTCLHDRVGPIRLVRTLFMLLLIGCAGSTVTGIDQRNSSPAYRFEP